MEIKVLDTGLYPNGFSTGILPIDSDVLCDLLFDDPLPSE